MIESTNTVEREPRGGDRRNRGRRGGRGEGRRSKENAADGNAPRQEVTSKSAASRRHSRKPRGDGPPRDGDVEKAALPLEERGLDAAADERVEMPVVLPALEEPSNGSEGLLVAAAIAQEQQVEALAAPQVPTTEAASSSPEDNEEATVAENEYVANMARKVRNSRKKLAKIAALEKRLAETPSLSLNEDQAELLKSKDRVQHFLAEYEAIKSQMVEIAKAELVSATTKKRPKASSTPAKHSHAQTDAHDPPRIAVERLLKLIYVVQRRGTAHLPTAVDLFCNSILGNAGLPEDEFHQCLQHGVAAAMKYLESSQEEVAPGVSFAEVEHIIENLAEQLRPGQGLFP